MKKILLLLTFLGIACSCSYAVTRNVATVAELRTAITNSSAGDIILLSGGTYTFTAKLEIKNKTGTATSYFTLMADPASTSRPKFDFSAMPENSSNVGFLLDNANYWLIKGIDIYKAGDNGMQIKASSNNIIEFCTFSECSDTGLQIDNGSANNLILNCDSYYNADSSIENADGFACKLNAGTGNTFKACRAWQNLDDGWDGYLKETNNITTYYENCWAFDNGRLKSGTLSGGDGNGFKSGGSDLKDLKHNAVYKNCIAAGNLKKGFDHNSNRGEVTLYNCAAYSNTQSNMGFGSVNPLSKLIIKNTLVFGSTGSVVADVVDIANNSWNSSPSITVSSANFQSIDITLLKTARKSDGSLPDVGFLKPVANSPLIDRGVNVGLTFSGSAPDIGPYEYVAPLPLNFLKFIGELNSTSGFIDLRWQTTNEVNTKDFEIYRKNENSSFVKIATIPAKNVSGINQYNFIDKTPLKGTNYYQIKQRDLDNQFNWSEIISIKVVSNKQDKIGVYPNPVTGICYLQHPLTTSDANYTLLNTSGVEVAHILLKEGNYLSTMDFSNINKGIYLLVLKNNNQTQSIKIIKN